MKYVMRIEGFATGDAPCSVAGQYIKTFDHEALGGQGYGVFTRDPEQAMQFDNFGDALEFWRKSPTIRPYRSDGKANRPLTATSMSILSLDEVMAKINQ